MAQSYKLLEGTIALELLTSVVVQRRVASLARTRWSGWSVVVVGVLLLLLLLLLLLVLVIVCKLLVLIVHMTPVTVECALLPGDKVNGQAVRPDILHFADRFCRGRHILSDMLLLSPSDQGGLAPIHG